MQEGGGFPFLVAHFFQLKAPPYVSHCAVAHHIFMCYIANVWLLRSRLGSKLTFWQI